MIKIKKNTFQLNKGFTLLELILVIGILAILGTAGFGIYFNFQLNIKVEEEGNKIQSILRQAQQKAISGEENSQWGIRFVYSQTGFQYYDIFWGTSYLTGTTTEKFYLPSGVEFTNPLASSTIDIIFNKRTGEVATSSPVIISVKTTTSDIVKNITITPKGLISRD